MPTPTHIGKYRIERELGRGGYATVYQAYAPTLDRRVAIRGPHAAHLADAEFVARFRRRRVHAAPPDPRRLAPNLPAWLPLAVAGSLLLVAALIVALVAGGCGRGATPSMPLPPLAPPPTVVTGGAGVFVEYIFDASAAMQAPFGGSSRLDAARRVLADHLRAQPVDANLGLRAFGHRQHFTERAASCQDVELIAAPQPGQGVRIAAWLELVQAQGLAPLSAALEAAFADFTAVPAHRNRVVILSSGADSCGRNPCAAVAELEAQGIHVDVHVIALGVDPDAVGQLACIAEQSGGALREVRDEKALQDALAEVAQEIAATPTPVPPTPRPAPAATTPAAPPRATAITPPATTVAPTATWTPTAFISPTATSTPYVEPRQTINVRAGPGLNYPIIGQVQVGDRLTPLAAYLNRDENRVWLLICCLPAGRAGWVAAELLSTPPAPLPTPATIPPSPPTATVRPIETVIPTPTFTPEKGAPPGPPTKEAVPTPKK
jgi:hypothetical protein